MKNNFNSYIVFTDLDGTLLDHDTYRFDEAKPALRRLIELDVPIIPTTSKTMAELDVLLKEMNILSPVIVENGGVIGMPAAMDFSSSTCSEHDNKFDLIYLSKRYGIIIEVLNKLRKKFGFKFRGFNDMSVLEVAGITGLNQSQAENAKQRLCSEPILWDDGEDQLAAFITLLKKYGFRVVQGGRFFHVMGGVDKSDAMKEVASLYEQNREQNLTVIALGDSPNDISMLRAADIGVVIRKKDQSCMAVESDKQIYTSRLTGPAGWNEFFLWLLDENKLIKQGAMNG